MRPILRHIPIDGDKHAPISVLTVRGKSAGPTAVVTANMHGDETTGLLAAHAVLDEVCAAGLHAGTLVVMPSLNAAGLEAGTRTVPADGGDLNRAFPGRRRGRATERLADRIWREVNDLSPDVVIDLHADADASIPYALLDRPVNLSVGGAKIMAEKLERLGRSSGLTVVHEYPAELYLRYSLDRSLAGALVNHNRCPAVTIEAGARRVAQPAAVGATRDAVLGILAGLSMISKAPPASKTRVQDGPWRRHAGPRSQTAGWLDPAIAPGTTFRRGDLLARIRHVDGRTLEALQASRTGLLLSWVEATWIAAGSVVGTLAVKEGR